MASTPTDASIVKAIKALGEGYSEAALAKKLGCTPSQLGGRHFKLEVEALPSLKIVVGGNENAASKRIVSTRNSGVRWERIAGRAGISVAEAKRLYKITGGDPDKSYTGRGRPPEKSGHKPAPAGKSGGGSGKGTSGRAAAARGGSGKKAATGGRGTRAGAKGRAAASGRRDPS
jgi:hypothetical protein